MQAHSTLTFLVALVYSDLLMMLPVQWTQSPLLRDLVPGFDVKPWHGLMAPAGTPPAIVNKLSLEVQAFLRTPEARAKLQDRGIIRVGNTAAEFQAFMAAEFDTYKKVIQSAGIKPE